MKLVHYELESPLMWDAPDVVVLAVENPRQYRKFVQQLYAQSKGKTGDWLLSNEGSLSLAKDTICLVNPFDLVDTQKRLQTKLLERLCANAYQDELYEATHQTLGQLQRYLLDLAEMVDADLELGSPELSGILKALGVRWTDSDNLLEQLVQIVNVAGTVSSIRLLITVNMRAYLDKEELAMFWQHCVLHDMCVLALEPTEPTRVAAETIRVIDQDLCEFVVPLPKV